MRTRILAALLLLAMAAPGRSEEILVFAAAKVLVNLVIDISYAFLDPRIRY